VAEETELHEGKVDGENGCADDQPHHDPWEGRTRNWRKDETNDWACRGCKGLVDFFV